MDVLEIVVKAVIIQNLSRCDTIIKKAQFDFILIKKTIKQRSRILSYCRQFITILR